MKNQVKEIEKNVLGANQAEEMESYIFLMEYLLDNGFSEKEAKIMIQKGTKAVAKHLESSK